MRLKKPSFGHKISNFRLNLTTQDEFICWSIYSIQEPLGALFFVATIFKGDDNNFCGVHNNIFPTMPYAHTLAV